jgi:hypothetical protein
MTPEQGAFLLQSIFLPVYTAEHPVTKAVIAAIPPDKADYGPDSIVRNAIDLAWHIVVAEDRFMNAVAAGGFTFDNAASSPFRPLYSCNRRSVTRSTTEGSCRRT